MFSTKISADPGFWHNSAAMHDFVGYVAGALTTAAFLPQVVKTIRSGRTKDISLTMYLMFCAGVFLWLIYGVVLGALPVILSNVVTLVLSLTILLLKLKKG